MSDSVNVQDLLRANTTLLQPGSRWFRVVDALLTLDIAQQVTQSFNSTNGQVATLQSQVATLQSQVATLQSQVATIQSQITALQNEDVNLQNQINTINTRLANAGIP